MNRFDDDAEDPRRRLLLQALALGLLGADAAGRRAEASIFGDVPKKLPPGQSIYKLEGRVLVNGKPATLATVINAADTIETDKGASIVFVVGKDAFMLRGGSKLVLAAYAKETSLIETLRLSAGRLLSVFGKGRQRLVTATSTVGIRGTGIYVEADPEETYLCTCYGVVDVGHTMDRNSREIIRATHHDSPRYIVAGQPSGRGIRPAPMKNHTDQELMLIEELVGRTPPFIYPTDDYGGPRREY